MNRKIILILSIVVISTINISCSAMMYNKAKIDDYKNGKYVKIKNIDDISVGDELIIEGMQGILCGVVVELDSSDFVSAKITFSQVKTISNNDIVKFDIREKATFYRYKNDVMMRLSGLYIDGVFIVMFTAIYLSIASIGNLQ